MHARRVIDRCGGARRMQLQRDEVSAGIRCYIIAPSRSNALLILPFPFPSSPLFQSVHVCGLSYLPRTFVV